MMLHPLKISVSLASRLVLRGALTQPTAPCSTQGLLSAVHLCFFPSFFSSPSLLLVFLPERPQPQPASHGEIKDQMDLSSCAALVPRV